MNDNLCLIFRLGFFSYAEIPKMYSLVLGVSGTILDMFEYEKKVISDIFKVRKFTYMPSMYGISQKKSSSNKNSNQ